MAHILILLTAILAAAPAAGAGRADAGRGAAIAYRFESDRFLITSIDLELGDGGAGRLVFVRKGLAKPVERTFQVTGGTVAGLWTALERIDFLRSQESYQSEKNHANLGTVTISAARDGLRREVSFNFTSNRDMWAVATTLRGIANREIYAFDLETAYRYQPLETPALLDALKRDLAGGRVADPEPLLPLLRQISEEFSLPLIARNRAGELAAAIEKGAGK